MKFKKLLPILFTVGMLAGCNPSAGGGSQTGGDTEDGTHTIEIVNKAEMEADWMIGDPTRLLQLKLTDNGEVKSDIGEFLAKNLTITIADSKVVSNNALTFTAMGEGTTTVALKYYGTQKHFNIKVVHRPTNKELYGTTHEGNEADPFDNEDALLVSHALEEQNALPTTEEYFFKGTVAQFYHEPGVGNKGNKKVCSWYYAPAKEGGERFEAYLVDIYKGQTQIEWTADDIWLGATATIKAKIAKPYNGQHETAGAVFVSATGEKPQPVPDTEANVAKAVEDGSKLQHQESSKGKYIITGYVVKKDDNNFFMADTKTVAEDVDIKTLFELYGVPADKQTNLLKGAKVKVTTKIKNYNGQVEDNGNIESIELLEAGEPWVEVPPTAATVTEALAVINGLEDGATTDAKYEVTGVVTSKQAKATYASYDFYIGETADATATLQCYRALSSADYDNLNVGDKVKVTGKLQKYVKDGVVKPEITGATWVKDGEGGGGGQQTGITLTPGTNGSNAVVKVGTAENPAVKVGTGSLAGDMTISGIPATATKVTLHAAAWNRKTAVLTVTVTNATADKETVTLTADSGISGNSPFTLAGSEATFVVEFNLTNVTDVVSIKLETTDTANGRFVVWGVTAE